MLLEMFVSNVDLELLIYISGKYPILLIPLVATYATVKEGNL